MHSDTAAPTGSPPWLVRNYGPRCTLVCAASVLRKLGARSERLVEIIERATGFKKSGPPARAYIGWRKSPLDRGIEEAARDGGIRVVSRTRLLVRYRHIVASLDRGLPVVLNSYLAPSGLWSHSVLAVGYQRKGRLILTLDPNDGQFRWMSWFLPWTGWVCTATYVERTG